jgi:putative membrane-bound dehydrogenase-like protein
MALWFQEQPMVRSTLTLAVSVVVGAVALWPDQTGEGVKPLPPAGKIASPLSPQAAQKEFRLTAGLRIELVACEPQIESPVAMQFDEDGRLWVVEMPDYPNGPAKGDQPQGRIKVLEDKDGDGFYETATVFADNLLFANGLSRWKDGVIVTAAPHIVWLRDTEGKGTCNKREVLYEGFAAQNPQLRISHPVLGIDGWVYCANGLRGGKVQAAGNPSAKVVDLSGRDFRFDPISGQYEAINGLGQFGNCFDDWGHRFVCDNRHHLRHVVMPPGAMEYNPYLGATEVHQDISVLDLDPGPLSSGGRVFPISSNWTTSNLHAARFTAACGVHIYRGQLLPKEFQGAAFTCEPTGNLVHQEILTPKGATFTSKPARDGVEFLASPDDWFRPVFLSSGPDGALYVVDMYRAVIEHPEFMPPELKNRPDLTLGKDKGRIWRIVPQDYQTKASRPDLGKKPTEELVKLLEHEDAWWRSTAQRLLLQHADFKVGTTPKLLREKLQKSKSSLAKAHAVGLLARAAELPNGEGTKQLLLEKDNHGRVFGLRSIAELPTAIRSSMTAETAALADSDDAEVRFAAALALADLGSAPTDVIPALAKIALRDVDHPWTRSAVAAAVPSSSGKLIGALLTMPSGLTAQSSVTRLQLLQELAAIAGARGDAEEIAALLLALQKLPEQDRARWQRAGLLGLAGGMGRRGTQLGAYLDKLPPTDRPAAEFGAAMLQGAGQLALDPKQELANRVEAVRLLAHASWKTAEGPLTQLLGAENTQELRLAAVRALAAQPQPEVARLLLASWTAYPPALRRESTEALMRQSSRIKVLLKEIEVGKVRPGDLDAARVRQLLNHKDPVIRGQATKLLEESQPADRKKAVAKYQAALFLDSDLPRGKIVFQKHCATCHRVAGVGVDVGPDISDSRTKTPGALLVDILNPNAAIDNNYVNYVITLKNGRTVTGLIASETAAGLTLKRAENQTETVLRADIDEIQSTGQSLMPEGLEKGITLQDMADLLAFLKNWRYQKN